MKNEIGETLDRNGYAPSIIPWPSDGCFICKKRGALQRHEIFHGALYRQRSKEYGLWVNLCYECHHKVHNKDSELDKELKRTGETVALWRYYWTVREFRERFGKNYLEDVDEE